MSPLREDQLEQIKAFIRQRGYKEIDLQYEILDHLACQVEEKMQIQGVSFENALIQSHQDYGVMGFSVIEDSIRKSLHKKNTQQFWSELKLWVGFPRVIFMFGMGSLFYKLSTHFSLDWVLYGTILLYILMQGWVFVKSYKELHKFRNTLIIQSNIFYTVILPVVLFQILIRMPQILKLIPEFWKPLILPILLTGLVLLLIFLVAATHRIFNYTLERCYAFEEQYGPM